MEKVRKIVAMIWKVEKKESNIDYGTFRSKKIVK